MVKLNMFLNILNKLGAPVLILPRIAKRVIVLIVDFILCIISVWLAFYLRLGEFVSPIGNNFWVSGVRWAILYSVVFALPIFIISGLYRAIFRYSGWPALLTVAQAVGFYALIYILLFTIIGISGVPRTVGIIQPILLLLFVGASRALVRIWLGDQYRGILSRASRPKALIYGAGKSGRQLAAAMANSHEMQIIGFIDDDDRLQGNVLNGLIIYNPVDVFDLVSTLSIRDVLLAMPNIGPKRRNEILTNIKTARVSVRTLPSVNDLAQGRVNFSELRELDIYDLLGREPVIPNDFLLSKNLFDKVILVTGAGGSIGSELCRQILAVGVRKLLLIEQSEFALYAIHQELESKLEGSHTVILPLLASVRDFEKMSEIMNTWRPDTVFHAAAYKHVPLVEHNPAEGIKNNVIGTLHTAKAARENGVNDFVLISSDKAVRPTNIMGASKRLAEMVLQAFADLNSGTCYSIVRFGNVLGSSGSVVPRFRQQIKDGGPITLTHPDITRFFMTISEAAQLVIQAGAMAKGGDVFLLDMGEPVKIIDLARKMIELSGLTVKNNENGEGDIEIEITGLRPGEKLFEELLIGNDPMRTEHSRILKADENFIKWTELELLLNDLEVALNANNAALIRSMIEKIVTGYEPNDRIVDWVYLELES